MNPWDLTCRPTNQQLARLISDAQQKVGYTKETDPEQISFYQIRDRGSPAWQLQPPCISSSNLLSLHLKSPILAEDVSVSPISSSKPIPSTPYSSPRLSGETPLDFTPDSSSFLSCYSGSSRNSSRSNSIETSGDELRVVAGMSLMKSIGSSLSKKTSQDELSERVKSGFDFDSSETLTIKHQQEDSSSSLSTQDAIVDRKARKKDQNRRAAYNYRRKKMEEKNRMREEEMRLVYSRVLLIGYAEKLEGSINLVLTANSKKMIRRDGESVYFSCPICQQSCDNINNLRSHLRLIHHSSDFDCVSGFIDENDYIRRDGVCNNITVKVNR